MTDTNKANIGHNNPPAHIAWMDHADALVELAEGLSEIKTPAQANDVGNLAKDAGKAKRDADAARKAAKKPHLDAAKEVDANFKPVVEKLDRVKSVADSLLTPWMREQRRIEEEAAEKARAVARAADEAARKAAAEANQSDMEEVEKAAQAEATAKQAAQDAKNARSAKTTVTGVRFRTYSTGQVSDRKALLTHIARTDPDAMTAFAAEWMRKAVYGGARDIPGVTIIEEQRAA